jgi:hypothetical protein
VYKTHHVVNFILTRSNIFLGTVTNGGLDTATEHQPAADSHQATNSGPEWVELFVREMSNASDMDDARARASRALEALTKSIVDGAGAAAAQSLHQVPIDASQ